jgi:hypothetical protein
MKKINAMILFLLALSWQAHGQLQLVNLQELLPGMEHHQSGKIPVFKSALKVPGENLVVTDAGLDLYDDANLMAVIDGQFVVLPKHQLAISNGFSPFNNLMNISNGFLQLNQSQGIGVWSELGISNGFLYFKGFASLPTMHAIKSSAVTISEEDVDPSKPSMQIPSNPEEDCQGSEDCRDLEYNWKLWFLLQELNNKFNPWDEITVVVDGVIMTMTAGAVEAHLRN